MYSMMYLIPVKSAPSGTNIGLVIHIVCTVRYGGYFNNIQRVIYQRQPPMNACALIQDCVRLLQEAAAADAARLRQRLLRQQ